MPLYRIKPLIVEAEQWFPGIEIIGVRRIPANRVDLSKTRGIKVDRPERWVCDTPDGEINILPGDWIIKDVFDDRRVCRKDMFNIMHEPLSVLDAGSKAPKKSHSIIERFFGRCK